MKQEELINTIKSKINFVDNENYNGLDMSGFDNSPYNNLEILSRFRTYMQPLSTEDNRDGRIILPIFWKGSGNIVCLKPQEDSVVLDDISGDTTVEILEKIIKFSNPKIID